MQGNAYLGDYGSAVTRGSIPHEVSIGTHWPSDLRYDETIMTTALDYYLLVVTLLELAGVITIDPSHGALTRSAVRATVAALGQGDAEFKGFLSALLL